MLLMKEFLEEMKVVGVLSEELEDAVWTAAVPSSCIWASDISSSEAGVAIFVF